jgi:gas vesicle protein
MSKSTKNVLIGFLTGIAAGAVIGILYAPDKGSKTRNKIKNKTKELGNNVTESLSKQVDNIKQHVSNFVDDIKSKFENLESEVKKKASDQQNAAAGLAEEKAKQTKKSA